ncbi:MAG: arylesterase [Stellaceae bacterium]
MMSLHGRGPTGGYGGSRRLVNCALAAALVTSLGTAASPARAAPVPTRILALGDSITAGYGLPPDDTLPAKLEARLKHDGYDVSVINGGVSGDTTAGGRARLAWALQDKPRFALVELGANDMLRGLDPKEAYANLDAILAGLKKAKVEPLLIGIRAIGNWGPDYQRQFDAIYPKLAAKWHVPLYPFLLQGVALDAALNQGDGLHPNEAGVAVIVHHLAPYVEAMLKKDEG